MSHVKALSSWNNEEYKLKRCLFLATRNFARNPTATSLTVDDVMKGNFNHSEALCQFVRDVVCGPNKRPSRSKKTRMDSVVSGIVFSTSNGRKVAGKHMALRSEVKSLTGSRKLLNWLLDGY